MVNDLDYKEIGRNVKIQRIRAEKTQEYCATRLKLSLQHWSNIETGNTKVSLPAIKSIANLFGVSVDSLLRGDVVNTIEVHNQEAQDILSDCDPYETRVIVDNMSSTKDALRRNEALRKKVEPSAI